MKADEMRKKDAEDLRKLLSETRRSLTNLRFRASVSDVVDAAQIRKTRREVARILTLLGERERSAGLAAPAGREGASP